MRADVDRPNTHHWPPIIYVVTLALAWLLTRLLPLPQWPVPAVLWWTGALLLGLGLVVAVLGLVSFQAVGTTFDPTGPASALATGGIYRFTRNPMYLGALLAFAGLGLVVPAPWLIVLLPGMAQALRHLAIDREEAYLERRFGALYEQYKATTRRWI